MRLLLDTHILIWAFENDPLLGDPARGALQDTGNALFLSTASLWEIAIKAGKGKLKMPPTILDVLTEMTVSILPVSAAHALATAALPQLHGDPFDRMLVAQARSEELTLMTRDRRLQDYGIPVWLV